jgi:hypothetical protein
MKIKVNKLTGPALDWAVAKCADLPFPFAYDDYGREYPVSPSTLWIQGGPIIERERIELIRWDGTWGVEEGTWVANIKHEDKRFGGMMLSEGQGTTPLIAAMRCYVASRLCDQFTNEVDVPDELLK